MTKERGSRHHQQFENVEPAEYDTRKQERRARLGRCIGAVALTPVILASSAYAAVMIESRVARDSYTDLQASLQHVADEGLDIDHPHATVFAAGLGTADSSWGARHSAPLAQSITPGDVYSLQQNPGGIDPYEAATVIYNTLGLNDTELAPTVNLYGYSIGSIQMSEIGCALKEQYEIIPNAIIADHGPTNGNSIRQQFRDQGAPLVDAVEIANKLGIPIEYSRWFRDIVVDPALGDDADKYNADLPLLYDQFMLGTQGDMTEILSCFDDVPTDKKPRIYYITSENPEDDNVIHVDRAEDALQTYSDANDLPLEVIRVQNASHGAHGANHDAYVEAADQYRDSKSSATETLQEIPQAQH